MGQFYQGGNYCISFSGAKTDRVFENELFKVIEPAAIQASLSACDVVNQKYLEKIEYLEKQLEQTQYEADRAFRQYNRVDPENRLVASELEARWNEKLHIANEVKLRIEKEKVEIPEPTSEEIETLASLSDRLAEVWRHPETDPVVKKQIIRMVVEEVLMDLNEETLMLTMTIRWKGGIHTQVKFKKPTKHDSPKTKTDENIVELLKRLSVHYPDEEIARIFSCHNYTTGAGNPWNRTRVRGLRVTNKIPPFDRKKKRSLVSLSEAAKRLDVNPYIVRQLIRKGLIKSKQIITWAPFQIEISELEKPMVKKVIEEYKRRGRLGKIKILDDRQLTFC
jgi:hypothetical protein